jgi:AraC family transcriptional regulator
MDENLIVWIAMTTFSQALAVESGKPLSSWPLLKEPTRRFYPRWKVPTLPFYHGARVMGCHYLAWSSMTAVVVDLRSEGQVSAELNPDFTWICISLEEVGGIFQISGDQPSGQECPMARGTFSVIPAGLRANGKGDGLTFMRHLLLQVDRRNLTETLGSQININAALAPRLMVLNARLKRLGQIIADECTAGTSNNQAYGDGISMAVLSALADAGEKDYERHEARGGLAPWRLTRVTRYLLENLSKPLELETQAVIAGLSKSHYCRAFKTSTGFSPHQWLLNARIEKAKQYLLADELPLAEIALTVGFTDQAHFTHTFSKIEGVSPRFWQRARSTPLQESEPTPIERRSPGSALPGHGRVRQHSARSSSSHC